MKKVQTKDSKNIYRHFSYEWNYFKSTKFRLLKYIFQCLVTIEINDDSHKSSLKLWKSFEETKIE